MPASVDAAHEPVDAGAVGVVRALGAPALVAGVVHEERQVGVGRGRRADVDRRGEAVAAGQALVHGDDRARRCRGPPAGTARRPPARRVVVVEEPAARRVRVHLPRAQVVGRGDVGHRRQRGVERADVGHGVALDQHPAVAAQLGGRAPGRAPWRRSTAGRPRRRRGSPRSRPRPCRSRRARGRASTRPRSSRSARPRRTRPAGSRRPTPPTRGSASARRRRSAPAAPSAAVVVVAVVVVASPWTVVVASSGSVAAVSRDGEPPARLGARRRRPLVAARLQDGQPRRHARPTTAGSAAATSRGAGRGASAAARARRIASARSSSSGGGRYSPFEHGHSFSGSPGSASSRPHSTPRLHATHASGRRRRQGGAGRRAAAGSGGGDEGLADEDGVVAGVGEAAGVVGVADAGLGDLDDAVGDRRGHPRRPVVVDLERHEVALVDADQRRPGLEGDLQLRLVVDLDEHVEAELDGELVELDQLAPVERGGDQQHGVGAHQPGVGDVVGGDREVLAQHRQRRRRPGRLRGRRPSRRRTPRR